MGGTNHKNFFYFSHLLIQSLKHTNIQTVSDDGQVSRCYIEEQPNSASIKAMLAMKLANLTDNRDCDCLEVL